MRSAISQKLKHGGSSCHRRGNAEGQRLSWVTRCACAHCFLAGNARSLAVRTTPHLKRIGVRRCLSSFSLILCMLILFAGASDLPEECVRFLQSGSAAPATDQRIRSRSRSLVALRCAMSVQPHIQHHVMQPATGGPAATLNELARAVCQFFNIACFSCHLARCAAVIAHRR